MKGGLNVINRMDSSDHYFCNWILLGKSKQMNSTKTKMLDKLLHLILILQHPHSEKEIREELGLKGRSNSAGYLQAIANHPELGPRLKYTMELTGGRPKKMWWIDYMGEK